MLAAVINNSCKKLDSISKTASTEEIEAKFFATKPGTPAIVHKVIAALKKQNSLGHFVPSLAKKDGYAIWEKSQVSIYNKALSRNGESETQETLVFTPIVPQDSNFVNGFFFSRIIGDSVELHLYRANDYDLFPKGKIDSSVVTAERNVFKVMELDQSIFGNRSFKVITDSIFENYFFALNPPTPKIISYKSDPSVVGKQVHMCVRMKGNNCTCGNVCLDWETCNECGYWFCFTIGSAEPPTGGGTYNWPPDPPISIGGGGGGGSSTGNCIPGNCRNGSTLIIEGRIPCGGCGNGPVVVVPSDEPPIILPQSDTIPKIIADSCGHQMDSLYLWGLANNFREQSFIVVKKGSRIYAKNFLPGFPTGDKTRVNYTLNNDEELICFGHIHAEDTANYWRTSFSPQDLMEFNSHANKVGYTAILEVGNARYAFVVKDVQKKSTFNIVKRGRHEQIYNQILESLEQQYPNAQIRTEQAWIQYLGSVSNCGIVFYKATSPNKNNFVILNP